MKWVKLSINLLIDFVFKARNILEPNTNITNDVTTNTGINAPKKPEWNIALLYCTRET